ncbi:cytochrome c oxidase subunit 3 (mitochondrion) [Babesia ovis]|uniref:Cytochrome c oxidase subunit 3 n=1 Tax=Babesia ovis TaxID=5869 RepID=A0A9W5TD19_BABOV|nr:cytochrome c oxidase subunit 3 [Babesia ovis]
MLIFSEILLFFGFIWSFLHVRWGDINVELPLNLAPYLNITSSLNVASSVISVLIYNMSVENFSDSERWLTAVFFIGLIFLSYQGDEYTFLQCGMNHDWFSLAFLVITGLHSLHVCVGVLFICSSISYYENDGSNKAEDFNIGIYWHFVELIWVALTLLLFLA